MPIEFLLERFSSARDRQALIWRGADYSFGWLLSEVDSWERHLRDWRVVSGSVVVVKGDYSPHAVALLLALARGGCIAAPVTAASSVRLDEIMEQARADAYIDLSDPFEPKFEARTPVGSHPLLEALRRRSAPGLILFTSGSTGASKAVLHDFSAILRKYRERRHSLRTIAFLQFDHIGGLDTLLYGLSNASCLITLEERSPLAVCRAIERYRAEVLPVSPSFINLLLLDDSWHRCDLTSLKIVTYGAEVMPEETLRRFCERFPGVRAVQKYGATEIGTLRSNSRSSDSVWVRIGGDGFATRVVDGMLEIKAESAMLGYLNAESPFTEDGWYKTGDAVETDGEFLRILGRKSDLINIGGEKAFPAEIEAVLQSIDGVEDAAVYGERHPILGQIVAAKVVLSSDESLESFRVRMRRHCKGKLAAFKVPQKVQIVDGLLLAGRLKKNRRPI